MGRQPGRLFKFIGIVTIFFGALFILYGGGSFFPMLMDGSALVLLSVMLLAAGIIQIIAVRKLWAYNKIGLTLYTVSQVLFLSAVGTFFAQREEEMAMIISLGVFLLIGVASLLYFRRSIKG